MRNIVIILIIFVLQASSCNREEPVIIKNNEGIITSKPASWVTSISEKSQYAAGASNSIKYKNTVVIGSIENGKNGITGIDVSDGEKLWTWQDNFANYTLGIYGSYTYANNLIFHEGRQLYWVNLATGTTVWKKRYDVGELPLFKNVNGLGKSVFVNATYSPYIEDKPTFVKIYRVSATSSTIIEIDSIGSDNPLISHDTGGIAAFKSDVGDTLIFTDTYEVLDEGRVYVNLYNISKKEWVYKKKETFLQAVARSRPKLHNGVVYFAADPYIFAIDLMSGEIIWKRHFGDKVHFTFPEFILIPEKNLIVFNAETSSTTLFALDLTSGSTVWSEPSSGTSSQSQYLNGVVYFVGGGDGLLHAVDIDTGKHLWKISSPDLAINSNAWFARYCAVFPGKNGEKGKVVVSSGLHAFAYEAER